MYQKHSLSSAADDKTVLSNPHKGWYWHYFDNGMRSPLYRDRIPPQEDYAAFPGLNHLYLRIDWADVQPGPHTFDWSEIDRVMEEWGAKGYTFAFRICCHESEPAQCFAAPKWLYELGCGGAFYKSGDAGGILTDANGGGTWEPDYGDPLFLHYLDEFLEAFARRFDGDSRVEYIDIGSYGVWGEGHTFYGSKKCYGLGVLKQHATLHAKYFKQTPVIVNDDFMTQLYGRPRQEQEEIQNFCYGLGLGIRDDSVLVGAWDYRPYHNTEFPALFADFSKNAPANIELAHFYHYTDEQAKGGLRIIEAARTCRITFLGFHGYPEIWLKQYPYLTEYLANRLGYWYFIRAVAHDSTAYAGAPSLFEIEWENAGFAPCYTKYLLELKYTAEDGSAFVYPQPDFDNRLLQEGQIHLSRHIANLSANMPKGLYFIAVRLLEEKTNRPVSLAIKDSCKDSDGFYRLSRIYVHSPMLP